MRGSVARVARIALIALPTLLAACDGDAPTIFDGRAPDAPCDCVDASDAMVRVLVFTPRGVIAGATVQFYDPAGALVAATTTDVDGFARAALPTGGSVTAVVPANAPGGAPMITTWLGVAPDDLLQLRAPSAASVTFDVTIPTHGTHPHYSISAPCGFADATLATPGPSLTATITLTGCGPIADLLVSADDGAGGDPMAFIATDVTIAGGVPLDLTASHYQPPVDATQRYTNLPTGVGAIEYGRTIMGSYGPLLVTSSIADVVGGTASGVVTVPPTPLPGPLVQVAVAWIDAAPFSAHVVYEGTVGDYALDTAGRLLAGFTSPASFDPPTRAITWSESATGAAADLAIATFTVDRGTPAPAWSWTVIGPHAAAELRAPLLTGDAAPLNPVIADQVVVQSLVTAAAPGGYDRVRARAMAVGGPDELAVELEGQIVIEQQRLAAGRVRW